MSISLWEEDGSQANIFCPWTSVRTFPLHWRSFWIENHSLPTSTRLSFHSQDPPSRVSLWTAKGQLFVSKLGQWWEENTSLHTFWVTIQLFSLLGSIKNLNLCQKLHRDNFPQSTSRYLKTIIRDREENVNALVMIFLCISYFQTLIQNELCPNNFKNVELQNFTY